jgi:glucosyl-3-phosphoglycerate synthase
MGDFHQSGSVATVHRLPGKSIEELRALYGGFAVHRPASIMIPALASELETPAFARIMAELEKASYIGEVVLVLGGAGPDEFTEARLAMEQLPMKCTVVWPQSDRLARVLEGVSSQLDVGPPGKGRDVWIALGYMLADGSMHAIALHDADIITYSEEIPLRLLFPLTHPDLDYQFCKGYYTRITDGMLHGRATRLLVAPLTSVLKEMTETPALSLVAAMRYPLAGEFAMTSELASRIPVARDWGLEVGTLAAVSAAAPAGRICQADLCENYEHKHQLLSPEDATRGLNRMAVEVTETLLRDAVAGPPPDDLPDLYLERATEMMAMYRTDALANGLDYDDDQEKKAVGTFALAIRVAMDRVAGKRGVEPLPPWGEVEGIVPGLSEAIREAVVEDNG